jgi:hypothetical protein
MDDRGLNEKVVTSTIKKLREDEAFLPKTDEEKEAIGLIRLMKFYGWDVPDPGSALRGGVRSANVALENPAGGVGAGLKSIGQSIGGLLGQ